MQKHILAAIVRRDEAEPSRVIEELDRTALTHGKLLSPFQLVCALTPRRGSGKSTKRERNRPAFHERVRPISTRVRNLPSKRLTLGARDRQTQDPSARFRREKYCDAKYLIGIGIVERDAVEGFRREVEMRPEIRRRRRHLCRSPDVAQRQARKATGPARTHRAVSAVRISALRRLTAVCPLLGPRVLNRDEREERAGKRGKEKFAGDSKLHHGAC